MDHPFPATGGILNDLRAGTSEAHQQLEDLVEIERCVASPGPYTRLLQAFYGFYLPLEARLAALEGWQIYGVDLSARHKTPWLAADLRSLRLPAAEIETLPTCVDLPPTGTLAQGFGCLYVLEGATLGGRQISALLRDSPITVEARRFFGSYGAETGARWRDFVVALESYAAGTGEEGRAEIIGVAQETFSSLRKWVVRICRCDEPAG